MGRSESRIAHIMKEYRSKIGEPDGKVVFENADKGDIFDGRTLRVCAYCRVSTDNDEQLTSFELQQEHYAKLVGTHENWNLIRIYADEGISGTSIKHREDFNQMIEDCRAGKYDLIVTKSVSRFARNLVDCVKLCRDLKGQNPPVGVYFETDNFNTLAEDSELKLAILATFAQEESVKKSESMNWSLKERFKNKKLLTPAPYGYERPRDVLGNYIKYAKLQIVEEEAKVVRLIYDAFLAGYPVSSIATMLTDAEVPNKLGNTIWHDGAIMYILSNERYCGCVLTWKQFTSNIFEHTKRKTVDERQQIFYANTHDAIIPIEKFEAAQALLEDRKLGFRGGIPILHVIDDGIFRGYLPINHRWINEDPLPYYNASKTVPDVSTNRRVRKSFFSAFDLAGYQVVRGAFVNSRGDRPMISISNQKIAFNSFCLKKFSDVQNVQLLLHPYERKIAIRPCEVTDTYSIHWRRDETSPITQKNLSCPHFANALFRIMEWDPDFSYRIIGTWIERDGKQIIVFSLENAMPIVVIDDAEENEEARKRKVAMCPEQWDSNFGDEFYAYSLNSLYFAPKTQEWNSDSKSRVVDGQMSYTIMSDADIESGFEELKAKGVISDD